MKIVTGRMSIIYDTRISIHLFRTCLIDKIIVTISSAINNICVEGSCQWIMNIRICRLCEMFQNSIDISPE